MYHSLSAPTGALLMSRRHAHMSTLVSGKGVARLKHMSVYLQAADCDDLPLGWWKSVRVLLRRVLRAGVSASRGMRMTVWASTSAHFRLDTRVYCGRCYGRVYPSPYCLRVLSVLGYVWLFIVINVLMKSKKQCIHFVD